MANAADSAWLGSMPGIYDQSLGPAIFAVPARHLAARAAEADPARVLELAAGTGILTGELATALPGAQIVATDLNPDMIERGSANVPGAHWQLADAMQLPFADAPFDLVACQFGVMFFPDRVAAYRDVHRVLAPGGTFLCSVWGELSGSELSQAVQDAVAEVLPHDTPDFFERIPFGYTDLDRIASDLQAAGLDCELVAREEYDGLPAIAATVAEGMCLGTPLRFELEQRGDLGDLVARVTELITQRYGDAPVTGRLAVIVAASTRS